MSTFFVIFNIYSVADDVFLPSAYITRESVDGGPGYIEQKATPETIPSFNLNLSDPVIKLIQFTAELQEQNIANKFNSNPKKRFTLKELLKQDEELTKTIKLFVWRKMNEWLKGVYRSKIMLTYNLPRKEEAKKHKLFFHVQNIKPELFFQLKDYGVIYKLKLFEEDRYIKVLEKDIDVIANNPAWVKIDRNLFQIPYINGTMLKPFGKKDLIYIPPKSVKTYFEKFIVKVASKADIKAEGFDMIDSKNLISCKLEIIQDLFTEEWVINPVFLYDYDTEFNWNDSRKQKLSVNSTVSPLQIVKVLRNREKEQEYISKLASFKLSVNASGTFYLKNQSSRASFVLHEWIITHKKELEQIGFEVSALSIQENEIYPYIPNISFTVEEQNDWFDVYAQVQVGDFTIPFNKLISNIKSGDPIYILPNGQVLIIPDEWMTKYEQLSKFATNEKKFLRYTKSQFTLLEDAGLIENEHSEIQEDLLKELSRTLLKATLRPYQKEGIEWMLNLYHKGLGGCLADDMGLGKTLQTITVLLYAKLMKQEVNVYEENLKTDGEQKQLNLFQDQLKDHSKSLKALIILPASLVFNWKEELSKFAPSLTTYIYTGAKRIKKAKHLSAFDVVLTTYHTALRDFDTLKEIRWEYIVLDESQQIKNKDGKVFKSISKLEANHKLALSGTPIENSLSDLWSQMQFINPQLLGGFSFFKKEFITPIEKRKSEEKKQVLYQLVNPYVLRRTKQEVAKDLPKLTTQVHYSEMSSKQEKLYEAEKSAVRNYILNVFKPTSGKDQIHVLQSLIKLRQLANHTQLAGYEDNEGAKFDDVIHLWNTVTKAGHKVLIFSSFVQYLALFEEHFKHHKAPYALLHGGLTTTQRKKQITLFEQDETIKTFLISIKAGGTGLNLTSADYVFILDPWWNPFVEKQAISRAHRIGQNKNVVAIKFITKNTIEEKILKLQEKKKELAEDIIRDNEPALLNKDVLDVLIE